MKVKNSKRANFPAELEKCMLKEKTIFDSDQDTFIYSCKRFQFFYFQRGQHDDLFSIL